MKKMIMLLVFAVAATVSYAQKGQLSAGFNLGHAFDSKNVITGVDFRYNLTEELRLAPSLSHFIKKHHVSAWAVDVNMHYVFRLTEMFGFYPLGGAGVSFWDLSGRNKSRLGLNIGLGGELYATEEVTVGLEMKYNIVSDFDQAIIALRVGYNF